MEKSGKIQCRKLQKVKSSPETEANEKYMPNAKKGEEKPSNWKAFLLENPNALAQITTHFKQKAQISTLKVRP